MLWRGDRQFGPMTGQELEAYFISKMAFAGDAVTGPGWPHRVPATDAARLLDLPGPVTAIPPDVPHSVVAVAVGADDSRVRATGSSTPIVLLWLFALAALQVRMSMHHALFSAAAVTEVLGHAVVIFLLVAAACFGVMGALGKMLRGQSPNATVPMFAMTAVYAGLFAYSYFGPQPTPPPVAVVVQATPASSRAESAPEFAGDPSWESSQESDSDAASALAPDSPSLTRVDIPSLPVREKVNAPAEHEVQAAPRKDWRSLAQALQSNRDWSGLLALANQWMADSPRDEGPWVFRGIAHGKLGQNGESLADFQHAQKFAPEEAYIWADISNSYMLMGDFINAEQAARKAIDLDEHYALAWNNLGVSLKLTGRLDEALAAFQRTVAENPSSVLGWTNLGDMYSRQGNWPGALDAYQAASSADPSDQTVAAKLANADRMQKMLNP